MLYEVITPAAKIIQIDIDPTSIHKNVKVDCPIVGDCKMALTDIAKLMEKEAPENFMNDRDAWLGRINEWKQLTPLKYDHSFDTIKPQYVVEKLHEITQGKAIVTTEVGQNQMWAAQYYHFEEPNHFVTSGGLGVMGFGLRITSYNVCYTKLLRITPRPPDVTKWLGSSK